MWQALRRNPFFLRSWRVWRRIEGAQARKGLWVWAGLLPLGAASLLALLQGAWTHPDVVLATWLALGVVALFILQTGYAISGTTSCYHRERDLGALTAASLTATSAWTEVWGRWAAALTRVFQDWVVGWLLVVAGAALVAFVGTASSADEALRFMFFWLFTGLWCGALGAIGLYCSARSRNVTAAVTGTITMVIGLPAAYAIAAGFITFYCNLSPKLLAWTVYLPPHPGAFFAIFYSDLPTASMAILAVTWTAFIALMLHLTARSIRDGIPLRIAAQAPPAPGPTGLVLAGTGMAPRPALFAVPVAQAAVPVAARVPQIQRRFDPSASQKPRTLMDHLLRPFRHNPFYVAYRRGFTRLYAGIAAAPGSALPPGLMICGLLGYTLSFRSELNSGQGEAYYAGGILLGAVALAALVSFIDVDLAFEILQNPEDPEQVLKLRDYPELEQLPWRTQASGVRVREAAAHVLERLWSRNVGGLQARREDAPTPSEVEVTEGELSYVLQRHRHRERCKREEKIRSYKREMGDLRCQVHGCGFDFETAYGEIGRDYAEVHHLQALSSLDSPAQTRLADLAIVCANCHRMVHRGNQCRNLEEVAPRGIGWKS